MSKVIYFSKINMISDHIFQVYEKKELLRQYLSFLLSDLVSGIIYTKSDTAIEDDEKITTSIEYRLDVRKKTDVYIDGYVYKESKVYYKELNNKNELIRKSVRNIEDIRFYFDVFKETVGFYTTNRFGYQEFNSAFMGIINTSMKLNNRDYRYEVALRTEGMNMVEIYEQLRKIKNIRELKLKMQPPNPDSEFLTNAQARGENVVSGMEEANITGMSFIFNSKGVNGLNLDSEMIQKNIEEVQALSEVVGDKKAVSKGYISIEAVGENGKKYTTAEQKPLKTVINRVEEFFGACKATIDSLL